MYGTVAQWLAAEIRTMTRQFILKRATAGRRQRVQVYQAWRMTVTFTIRGSDSRAGAGDGLVMAIEAGAQLGNMSHAFWQQSVLEMKPQHRAAKPNYLLGSDERARPGAILVNRAGKRFVNEAANYNAMGKALHAFDAGTHSYANLPYWLIIDQRYKDKYPTFTSPPGSPIPSYMIQAETLEDLAAKAGIDGAGLVATVERFNAMVRNGHDDDFNRGDNTYDN